MSNGPTDKQCHITVHDGNSGDGIVENVVIEIRDNVEKRK